MDSYKLKIVVLISGHGSNLQAIIDAIQSHQLAASLIAVISDNQEAHGLNRARLNHIPVYIVSNEDHPGRAAWEIALSNQLEQLSPDLIALAGFMRILGKNILKTFEHRIINIHPSLLPKYPGLNTHQQVVNNNESEHGCSIHYVTENIDGGPLIAQASFKIKQGETVDSLKEKVHQAEHFLYPTVLHWFTMGRIKLIDNQIYIDNIPLAKTGLRFEISCIVCFDECYT